MCVSYMYAFVCITVLHGICFRRVCRTWHLFSACLYNMAFVSACLYNIAFVFGVSVEHDICFRRVCITYFCFRRVCITWYLFPACLYKMVFDLHRMQIGKSCDHDELYVFKPISPEDAR